MDMLGSYHGEIHYQERPLTWLGRAYVFANNFIDAPFTVLDLQNAALLVQIIDGCAHLATRELRH
jgi:hypothetical protein